MRKQQDFRAANGGFVEGFEKDRAIGVLTRKQRRKDGGEGVEPVPGLMPLCPIRLLLCCMLGLQLVLVSDTSWAQTNAWTKNVSGNWEEPFWSLAALPSSTQSIMITNAGFKAVGISINTVNVASNSLTVSNLTVNAPPGSFNTLLLNYSGVVNPLRALGNFYLGTNGQFINLSGTLRTESATRGAFTADGTVIQSEGGQMFFQHAWFGKSGPAAVWMTNGVVSAKSLLLGTLYPVSFLQLGGTNTVDLMEVNRDGSTYDFNGGSIKAGLLCVNFPDFASSGGGYSRFLQRGGSVQVTEGLLMGKYYSGAYTLYSGRVNAVGIGVSGTEGFGTFYQGGGTNTCGSLTVGSGRDSWGQYHLTNGVLTTSNALIGGYDTGSLGHFYQYGGVHNAGAIIVSGYFDDYESPGHGGYTMSGGLLTSTNMKITTFGSFTQQSGTNSVSGPMNFEGYGKYYISGGLLSVSNITTSFPRYFSDIGFLGATITQTGGTVRVAGEVKMDGYSAFDLLAGNLEVPSITLEHSKFYFGGGQVLSNQSFRLGGASTLVMGGASPSLGKFIVNEGAPWEYPTNNPTIDFGTNGGGVVRFSGSADVAWGNGATLFIRNWVGALNGGGADRLLIGTNQGGVTAKQLAQIVFVNPAGLASGSYPARVLSNGEIVPGTQPSLAFVRGAGNVQFIWATPWTLQTATNLVPALGWVDVPGARSPWTNLVNEPRRFFRLRK